MVTHSPSFGRLPDERARRADSNSSSRLRLAYLDGWGSDDRTATARRESRLGTWAAALAGGALGIAVVALYAGGVIGGATLGETSVTVSREPSWSLNSEYTRAIHVQARALASGSLESAAQTPVNRSASPAEASAPTESNAQPAPAPATPHPAQEPAVRDNPY